MHRHGEVTVSWADGDHAFRLGLGELQELEEKFDRSIFVIAERLSSSTATSLEIREVLRIGLIGGGMKATDALALIRRYVDELPLFESLAAAKIVAMAALMRLDKVNENDPPAGEENAKPSGSTSPEFTEPQS